MSKDNNAKVKVKKAIERVVSFDKIVSSITALGVPGLILVTATAASGFAGAAALTTSLAAIGPGGMLAGIGTLGVIGLISKGIAEYGVDAIYIAVIKELFKQGETKESILEKISKYKISTTLKLKLINVLENI